MSTFNNNYFLRWIFSACPNRTYTCTGKAINTYEADVSGALVGGPRAYQDQFHGIKLHRVHARGFFLPKIN